MRSHVLVRVSTRRTTHKAGPRRSKPSCSGYLVESPQIGNPLIVVREGDAEPMITTPVIRLLAVDGAVYVETRNSVYRLGISNQ
jgi:hypothetical protein